MNSAKKIKLFLSAIVVSLLFIVVLHFLGLWRSNVDVEDVKVKDNDSFQATKDEPIAKNKRIPPRFRPNTSCSIRIHVVKGHDRKALSGAGVEFAPITEDSGENQKQYRKTTDAAGIATFRCQQPLSFQVLVHANGCLEKRASLSLKKTQGKMDDVQLTLLESSEGVTVEEGTKTIHFVLEREATLYGSVIDMEGNPCAGLQVSAVPVDKILTPEELRKSENRKAAAHVRHYFANFLVNNDKGIPYRLRGSWYADHDLRRDRTEEQMSYMIVQALEGYSIFSERYQDWENRRKVLTTDEKGQFEAKNIRPGEETQITVFGSTSDGARIAPYEEIVVLKDPGPHKAEFQVEFGTTIVCSLKLPEGSWDSEAENSVVWNLCLIENEKVKKIYHHRIRVSQEGDFVIGPFYGLPKQTKLAVSVMRLFHKENKKERFRGIVEPLQLTTGVHHVIVDLERIPERKKVTSQATIEIVDEAGRPIGSGTLCECVSGWVRHKDGHYVRS